MLCCSYISNVHLELQLGPQIEQDKETRECLLADFRDVRGIGHGSVIGKSQTYSGFSDLATLMRSPVRHVSECVDLVEEYRRSGDQVFPCGVFAKANTLYIRGYQWKPPHGTKLSNFNSGKVKEIKSKQDTTWLDSTLCQIKLGNVRVAKAMLRSSDGKEAATSIYYLGLAMVALRSQ